MSINIFPLYNIVMVGILLTMSGTTSVLGNEKTDQKHNMNQDLKLNEQITRFEETENIEQLGNIIGAIQRVGDKTERLESYVKILEIAQKLHDSKFNFKEQVFLNIAPPEETGLRAGVDPREIKDPVLREKYERALDENKLKLERARLQNTLRRSISEIQEKIKTMLINQCPDKDTDKAGKFLEQAGASPETVKKILEMVRQDHVL